MLTFGCSSAWTLCKSSFSTWSLQFMLYSMTFIWWLQFTGYFAFNILDCHSETDNIHPLRACTIHNLSTLPLIGLDVDNVILICTLPFVLEYRISLYIKGQLLAVGSLWSCEHFEDLCQRDECSFSVKLTVITKRVSKMAIWASFGQKT